MMDDRKIITKIQYKIIPKMNRICSKNMQFDFTVIININIMCLAVIIVYK